MKIMHTTAVNKSVFSIDVDKTVIAWKEESNARLDYVIPVFTNIKHSREVYGFQPAISIDLLRVPTE